MKSDHHANDSDLSRLSREFTEDMYETYRYLVNHCNYQSPNFLHLVTMLGGAEAANQALDFSDAPNGFYRLQKIDQLGRSIEAWVQLPKYEPLFSAARRAVARQRLLDAGFDLEGFLKASSQS